MRQNHRPNAPTEDIQLLEDQHVPPIRGLSYQIESTKTTSMEHVSTGVLEKMNNIYEVKIKPKMI